MPREYPLAFFEMSFLLPHFLQRRPRQARDVLHARLQPGVDESRRDVVDRGAHRRDESGAPRVPDADLERDGVVRGLRAADGARLGAPRPHVAGDARRALDRLPSARAARRAREERASASISPGRRTKRPASDRSGKKTSSGSSSPGGSTRTARSASGSTSSRRIARARSSRIEEQYRWMFENSVPGLPAAAAKEQLTPLEYMRKYGAFLIEDGVYRTHEQAPGAKDLDGATVDPVTQRHQQGRTAGRRRDRRPAAHRLSHPLTQARVLLEHLEVVEVAGPGRAELHPEPRPLVEPRSRQGRDGAAADVQAPDLDPHALGQREVALRDLPHESALAASRGRRRGSAWRPAIS